MSSERVSRVVRIPRGLYELVAEQAVREDRSINEQIVLSLRQVFEKHKNVPGIGVYRRVVVTSE